MQCIYDNDGKLYRNRLLPHLPDRLREALSTVIVDHHTQTMLVLMCPETSRNEDGRPRYREIEIEMPSDTPTDAIVARICLECP